MSRKHAGRAAVAGALALGLAVPAAAQAAGAPNVTTGGVTARTTTTVTIHGRVDPNGAATRYYFQFGTTRAYGGTTTVTNAGSGASAKGVSAALTGLAPATRYHYRLIAENRFDIRRGEDKTFKTARQPLGLTLGANPNPVLANDPTTLSGTLSGTGNAGRQVVLQYQLWPYTAPYAQAGNPLITDANGAFAFPVPNVSINTQARVVLPDKPGVVSPVVLLQALARVRTDVKTKRYPRSKRVRFTGTVTPAVDGEQMQVQRLVGGTWEVVRTMRAKHRKGGTSSRFRKTMLIRETGRYRIFANIASGAYTSSAGREVKVKFHRR
jgi:hypothetical protein